MFTSNNVLVLDRDFYVISHGFHFHRFSKLTVVTKTLFVCFIQVYFTFCFLLVYPLPKYYIFCRSVKFTLLLR